LSNNTFNIDQGPVAKLMTNGVGYYFTDDDYNWCTRCFVYYYVEVLNPGRYYVTGTATARNPTIAAN